MGLPFKSYWLKSGLLTLMQRGSILLFGIGGFMILVRLLNKQDYGTWMLYISIITIMEMIRNGFVRNSMVKFLAAAQDESDTKHILSASLLLHLGIVLLQTLFILGVSQFLPEFWSAPGLDDILYIAIPGLFFLLPFCHFEFVQQANLSFMGTFWSHFVRRGGLFFYILLAFLLDWEVTLVSLAWVQVITVLFGAIVGYVYTRRYTWFSTSYKHTWFTELFHYGKYTFGTNISSMLTSNMDQWMLGRMISPAAVAIYSPALRVANLVEVPTVSVSSIVFPQVAKRIEEEGPGAAKRLYEKSVALILAIILPLSAIIFLLAEPVILILAGREYLNTVPILQVTIFYSFFVPFARQFGTVLDGMNMPKVNFYFVLLNAVLNAIFNYFFIKSYGVIGAAYGTLSSFIVAFILNQIYLNRKLGVKLGRIVSEMFNFYFVGIRTGTGFIKARLIPRNS
ncbi:flippase [Roseivirga sp. BDSF3-8]|uniref:flippase n=1 Tax=Roseivirga sp. BDSF3-8 TaxID=3241598 RepID=UPI003531AAF3